MRDDWAPVFGWRVRDVAHLLLGREAEELPWTDESGANLVIFPWWEELYAIVEKYKGIDIYDVPLFNDGYGGPDPSSQVGGENAVFIGALIRLPFQDNKRWAKEMNILNSTSREERKAGISRINPEWARTLADDYFSIEKGRIEEMMEGFDNLRKFMEDHRNLPDIIQAEGNHPDYHDDIEPTWPLDFLIGNESFPGEIIDRRKG